MTKSDNENVSIPPVPAQEVDLGPTGDVPPQVSFSFLRADGPFLVDERKNPVVLRGCNLGNWFLLEMWMLDIHNIRDQYEFVSILRQRFGRQVANQLLNAYRENWITARDFNLIKSFGFNAVRLPFHYTLLEDDDHPFRLRDDAFQWLDRALELASNAGLYVVLDMHGAPGGQSKDHTTGRTGENRLWNDETCRKRFVWLWREIARRYADHPIIAAYDLLNEPFGVESEAEHRVLAELMASTIRAIRAEGDRHVVFLPATRTGWTFYGSPADRGWTDVGFTDHFYPGLFGSEPTRENHARFIYRILPSIAVLQRKMNAPFMVGEFNVVFEQAGGAPLMRHYYDLYAGYGWSAMLWSYKVIKEKGGTGKDSWGMVVNRDPAPSLDIRSSSLQDIETYIQWLGSMPYVVNTALRSALISEEPPIVDLPPLDPVMTAPPATDAVEPWAAVDIGHALPGGQKKLSDHALEVYGGGNDIWGKHDQFRFIYRQVSGDFKVRTDVVSLSNTHVYAKAGLMIRASLSADAPHVLLHVFSSGQTAVAWREMPGGATKQKALWNTPLPARLFMQRRNNYLDLAVVASAGNVTNLTIKLSAPLRGPVCVGLAVLSHDNSCLTTARFQDIRFETDNR